MNWRVGTRVGLTEGDTVGVVGLLDGLTVGEDGCDEGDIVGISVQLKVGSGVGDSV